METGKLTYSERAFRQDTGEAMKNDIVLALIELLTNSDDAYRQINASGKIEIEIERMESPYKYKVLVRDHATGLSGTKMRDKLTNLGGINEESKTAKFEHQGTRGLFGRGAKDIAIFGKAVYESIRDNLYSALEIDSNMNYRILSMDSPVTKETRKLTKIPENGFLVTINVLHLRASRVPKFNYLAKRISDHFALRDLLNKHQVTLKNNNSNQQQTLHFIKKPSELILEKEVNLEFYAKPVYFKLYKLIEPDSSLVDDYTQCGILIKDSRAIYQNTFFDLRGRPESLHFSGELIANEIDDLNRSYDSQEENPEKFSDADIEKNPLRLVKRSRDGLERSHPFYKALSKAITQEIKPFFDQMHIEEEKSAKESEKLKKRLDSATRELTEALRDALDSNLIDLDYSEGMQPKLNHIFINPPVLKVDKGATASVQLWVPQTIFKDETFNLNFIDDSNIFTIQKIDEMWRDHELLDVKILPIKVTAQEYGSTELIFKYNDQTVSSKFICHISVDELEIPDQLEWEKPAYKISVLKNRILRIFGPSSYLGKSISLKFENRYFSEVKANNFKLNSDTTFAVANVEIKTTNHQGRTELIAMVGDEEISCIVEVQEPSAKGGLNLEWKFEHTDSPVRSVLQELENKLILVIYTQHISIRNLLGVQQGDDFEFGDSDKFLATLSEIVSQSLANFVIEKSQEIQPFDDASSLIVRQQGLQSKFAIIMQKKFDLV